MPPCQVDNLEAADAVVYTAREDDGTEIFYPDGIQSDIYFVIRLKKWQHDGLGGRVWDHHPQHPPFMLRHHPRLCGPTDSVPGKADDLEMISISRLQ